MRTAKKENAINILNAIQFLSDSSSTGSVFLRPCFFTDSVFGILFENKSNKARLVHEIYKVCISCLLLPKCLECI